MSSNSPDVSFCSNTLLLDFLAFSFNSYYLFSFIERDFVYLRLFTKQFLFTPFIAVMELMLDSWHIHNVNKLMFLFDGKRKKTILCTSLLMDLVFMRCSFMHMWCMRRILFFSTNFFSIYIQIFFCFTTRIAEEKSHQTLEQNGIVLHEMVLFWFVSRENSKCRTNTKKPTAHRISSIGISQRLRWAIKCFFAVPFYSICLYCSSYIQDIYICCCCHYCCGCCCCRGSCCCCFYCGLANTLIHTLDKKKQRQQNDK